MGSFEKFLFENSFDKEQTAKAKAKAAAQAVPEEPPAPTFSEADLAAAREAAFAEGSAAGVAEAENCHAARLAGAVEALPPQIAQLTQAAAAAEEARRRDSLEAALTVVRKLFPHLARSHGLAEVQAVIEQCLERLRDEPRLVIRCADADLDALRERTEQSAAGGGFEGKLVLLADERLASGDVRVEWADGGAERGQAALWQEIDAVIGRALAPACETRERKQTPQPAATQGTSPGGAASPTPRPDAPAAVQPLRRAQRA
jgi:flagellar assembly protein FliH